MHVHSFLFFFFFFMPRHPVAHKEQVDETAWGFYGIMTFIYASITGLLGADQHRPCIEKTLWP